MRTNNGEVNVRAANLGDVDRLVAIYIAACHTAYADILNDSYHQFLDDNAANGTWKQAYEDRLNAPLTTVLAIEAAEQVEGFAFLTAKGNGTGELEELFFHPSAMGKGLGTILFDAVIELARALSITKFRLQVVERNTRALAFHQSKGWIETRRYSHTTAGQQTIQMLELALTIDPATKPRANAGQRFLRTGS
jgi:GNAT superfamily N-acetyltransferase